MTKQAFEVADQEEAKLKEEFTKLAETLGLKLTDGLTRDGATASWVEESGRQVDVIKHHGRMADLIAVAKPDRDRNLGTNTLKAALFHTGTPVMMCPPASSAPEILGKHVSIAWNGSMEASRAVALTVGILEKADKVTVFSAGNETHGATSNDLVEYLSLRDIAVSVKKIDANGNVGEELLRHSASEGADLMVMGAYGDSHERETLFGGNTQSVVDQAQMPVILVH